MFRLKAVLLDMDGTLLDGTKTAICRCIQACFMQHGFPPPSDQAILNEIYKGDLKSVLSCLSPSNHRNDDFIELTVKEIDYSFTRFMPKRATLVNGTTEVIRWLQVRGFKVAIVTNASESMLKQFLQSFGLTNSVDIAISANKADPKPSPDGIFKSLDFFGTRPKRAVMVGDTVTDIGAGLNAETLTIGVLTGIGTKEELRDAGASHIISSVASLPKLIRRI
jgi:phosphoglycolate phosphatase